MQKITPCLWYDKEAEDAARLYVSIFPNSAIGDVSRYGKEGYEIHGKPEGTVLTVDFTLNGQPFTALNGGPAFKFTEAVSFQIECKSQEEIDHYWNRLGDGGTYQMCGWLKDRFGLSWQVTPSVLAELMKDKDPAKSGRVMNAMLKMQKFDIAALQAAYKG